MSERKDRGPKPRVRPQMNTETRRHDERSAYHRKAKYWKAPILDQDDEDGELPDEEEGGVLDDLMDGAEGMDEQEPADEAPKPRRQPRSRG